MFWVVCFTVCKYYNLGCLCYKLENTFIEFLFQSINFRTKENNSKAKMEFGPVEGAPLWQFNPEAYLTTWAM